MSLPSGSPLTLALLVALPWPALAHPGVPDQVSSQVLHALTHGDHVSVLIGIGALAAGLALGLWRRPAGIHWIARIRARRSRWL